MDPLAKTPRPTLNPKPRLLQPLNIPTPTPSTFEHPQALNPPRFPADLSGRTGGLVLVSGANSRLTEL